MNPDVILCVFAVYVISLVMTEYAGPFDVFARIRAKQPDGPWACFVCLSFWISLAFGISYFLNPLELFAVWGGAILIWKVSEK